ncbi:uncharacterized protein LOC120342990 [Styela clava]
MFAMLRHLIGCAVIGILCTSKKIGGDPIKSRFDDETFPRNSNICKPLFKEPKCLASFQQCDKSLNLQQSILSSQLTLVKHGGIWEQRSYHGRKLPRRMVQLPFMFHRYREMLSIAQNYLVTTAKVELNTSYTAIRANLFSLCSAMHLKRHIQNRKVEFDEGNNNTNAFLFDILDDESFRIWKKRMGRLYNRHSRKQHHHWFLAEMLFHIKALIEKYQFLHRVNSCSVTSLSMSDETFMF